MVEYMVGIAVIVVIAVLLWRNKKGSRGAQSDIIADNRTRQTTVEK